MAKAFKVRARKVDFGARKGQTVYNVSPVSYGTLSTDDAARQISVESSLSPGDVKNVLDRYAHYVVQNLRNGYDIEMLGFGSIYLRFITAQSVSNRVDADASLVRNVVPGFRPSFFYDDRHKRRYNLVPEPVQLVPFSKQQASGKISDAAATPAASAAPTVE
ncbi:MAG: DNA-binding protein [Prevotellaceae bacterium]|nr:DNA-binding protein [Prevotellaceae bacterium]